MYVQKTAAGMLLGLLRRGQAVQADWPTLQRLCQVWISTHKACKERKNSSSEYAIDGGRLVQALTCIWFVQGRF